jgi:YVTN family beta-propeller protein
VLIVKSEETLYMSYRIGLLFVLLSCASALPSHAQTLVTDIAVSGAPSGIAVNPANNRVYVSLSTSTGFAVAVIDGSSNTVIDTVTVPQAFVIAANAANGRVYTAGCDFAQSPIQCGVTVIDGATNSVITTIPLKATTEGIGLQGIAVNPKTNKIYVSDDNNLKVQVIDGYTNTVIAHLRMDRQQFLGLAVDTSTNQIAAAIDGNELAVINGSTNAITRITVGNFNANVAVDSTTNRAYVTNETFAPSTVGVVDLVTSKVLANVATGNNPFGVAVDPRSDLVFVTNKGDNTVAVVDGKTNAKTGSVTVSSNFIDVNPVTKLIYTSDDSGADVVHVISE